MARAGKYYRYPDTISNRSDLTWEEKMKFKPYKCKCKYCPHYHLSSKVNPNKQTKGKD